MSPSPFPRQYRPYIMTLELSFLRFFFLCLSLGKKPQKKCHRKQKKRLISFYFYFLSYDACRLSRNHDTCNISFNWNLFVNPTSAGFKRGTDKLRTWPRRRRFYGLIAPPREVKTTTRVSVCTVWSIPASQRSNQERILLKYIVGREQRHSPGETICRAQCTFFFAAVSPVLNLERDSQMDTLHREHFVLSSKCINCTKQIL